MDFDTTGNLIIEGDNLEVLKLLRKSYFGKVKCIYIDPPYNTGHDFVYSDNFTEGKQAYWEQNGVFHDGMRMDTNTESAGRYHSNWLNMMQNRLLLARQLLRDDGVIFVSIDDHEVHNLRKLMDEVFGEENFVAQIVWENREGGGGSDSKYFKIKHEYVCVFAKDIEQLVIPGSEVEDDSGYPGQDEHVKERGKYKLIKLNSFSIQYSPSLDYPIEAPDGGDIHPSENGKRGCWRWSKKKYEWGAQNGFIVVKKNGGDNWIIYTKQYFSVDNEDKPITRTLPPLAVIQEYSSTMATKQMEDIFGEKVFDYSKPYPLIKKLINFVSRKGADDLILDFFAGSGTTAQAVMALNKEDGGNRKFILVQLPEETDEKSEARKAGYNTISQITIERVKRAGARINGDVGEGFIPSRSEKLKVDTGFRVFELTRSLFPDTAYARDPEKTDAENEVALKECLERSKQVLTFLFDRDELLAEIALKDGFDATFTATKQDEFTDNFVFLLADASKSARICLDHELTMPTVDRLIKDHKSDRFICLHRAVDTTKLWKLNHSLGSNLWVT
ncbi:MAG: site-specific DNA-methyltransferase [bacterium]|nr:site-specific DNA-methyltransferase [bacterium]